MRNIEKYENEVIDNVNYCDLVTELVRMGVYTRGVCRHSECEECKRHLRAWLNEDYRQPVLDGVERKYLSDVIKPFRDIVIGMRKELFYGDGTKEYISIVIQHESGFKECVNMPNFERNAMYKGMEINKKYSLKELGL